VYVQLHVHAVFPVQLVAWARSAVAALDWQMESDHIRRVNCCHSLRQFDHRLYGGIQ
jgi:hypothetical protein